MESIDDLSLTAAQRQAVLAKMKAGARRDTAMWEVLFPPEDDEESWDGKVIAGESALSNAGIGANRGARMDSSGRGLEIGRRVMNQPVRDVPAAGAAGVLSFSDMVGRGNGGGSQDGSGPSERFFQSYVRTDRKKGLLMWLKAAGLVVPKAADTDLALATYTLATVPPAFVDGQERLRMFEQLGDNVAGATLTIVAMRRKMGVKELSEWKATRLSNFFLRTAAEQTGLTNLFVYAAGVSAASKATSKAVEVVVGVVARWCGIEQVEKLLVHLGVIDEVQFGAGTTGRGAAAKGRVVPVLSREQVGVQAETSRVPNVPQPGVRKVRAEAGPSHAAMIEAFSEFIKERGFTA